MITHFQVKFKIQGKNTLEIKSRVKIICIAEHQSFVSSFNKVRVEIPANVVPNPVTLVLRAGYFPTCKASCDITANVMSTGGLTASEFPQVQNSVCKTIERYPV